MSRNEIEKALVQVRETGESVTLGELVLGGTQEGRTFTYTAEYGDSFYHNTNAREFAGELSKLISASEQEVQEVTEPEVATMIETVELAPEPVEEEPTPVVEEVQAVSQYTKKTNRVRETALEREMNARLQALSANSGYNFGTSRSAEKRYMRALFDLTLDSEPLFDGLTVNEVVLVAEAIVRARAIASKKVAQAA